MFNRPGKKLKSIAIIIFFLCVLLGALGGGILASSLSDQLVEQTQASLLFFGDLRPESFFLIMLGGVVGMIVGWLNSIILYSFGTLVDDVETIKESLRK